MTRPPGEGVTSSACPPQSSIAPSPPASMQDLAEQLLVLAMQDFACDAREAAEILGHIFARTAAIEPPTVH